MSNFNPLHSKNISPEQRQQLDNDNKQDKAIQNQMSKDHSYVFSANFPHFTINITVYLSMISITHSVQTYRNERCEKSPASKINSLISSLPPVLLCSQCSTKSYEIITVRSWGIW
jgi:hypothetical protein